MRLTIENKLNKEIFTSIFHLLKNWGSYIKMQYSKDGLYIQTMDKSHICLSEINIVNTWFSEYTCDKNINISVSSPNFALLTNYSLKHDILEIKYDEKDETKLYINFLNLKENKSSYEHFFEIPLIDTDDEIMGIPNVDYPVDLTIDAKKFTDVLGELCVFGQDLNVTCNENNFNLIASGDSGLLKVQIPIDDLIEFAISEDENIDISYSINHVFKMCTSVKLSSVIKMSISEDYPMKLSYDLGNGSNANFYVAPKVSTNDD
jgi:proliferating cell nuclear antigen